MLVSFNGMFGRALERALFFIFLNKALRGEINNTNIWKED